MESIKEAEKTIVWIEHDAVDTEECRELLGREGFSIRAANHGVAALEVLRELTPCAVVLDLDLPRMTGQEIFKFIRTTSRLAAVPVVIYSDRTMAEWPKNVPPGLTRCLSKTGTPSPVLLQTIDELIEEAAAIAGYAAAETAPDVPHGEFIEVPRDLAAFITDARTTLVAVRSLCLEYAKEPGSEAAKSAVESMHGRIRKLHEAGSSFAATHFVEVLKALDLFVAEVALKPAWSTPSGRLTLVQAIDCLSAALREGDVAFTPVPANPSVLAVDDDPICNHVIVTTLNRAGFRVKTEESPRRALEIAGTEQFDTILLDVNMPEMTGFQLCEQLRKIPNCALVPVVFITAFNNFENRKQSVLAGGHDFVTKPISPWELALKLKIRLLQQKLRRTEPERSQDQPGAQNETAIRHQLSEATTRSATATEDEREQTQAAELNGHQSKEAPQTTTGALRKEDVERTEPVPIAPPTLTSSSSASECRPVSITTAASCDCRKSAASKGAQSNTAFRTKAQPPNKDKAMTENSNSPFEKIVQEVARIIFGDGQLSEINLRLVRMALERHNVDQIIRNASKG